MYGNGIQRYVFIITPITTQHHQARQKRATRARHQETNALRAGIAIIWQSIGQTSRPNSSKAMKFIAKRPLLRRSGLSDLRGNTASVRDKREAPPLRYGLSLFQWRCGSREQAGFILPPTKTSIGGVFKTKEEIMDRLIMTQELHSLNETELRALLQEVSQQITRSNTGSHERRNALASYENIMRTLNMRRAKQFKPTMSP